MNAKEFYEEMRRAGFTENITSNSEPDYNEPFYQDIFSLMEAFSNHRKVSPVTEFEDVTRPVIKYLCDNYHPHVTVVITPTSAELLEGKMSTGQILDYVQD